MAKEQEDIVVLKEDDSSADDLSIPIDELLENQNETATAEPIKEQTEPKTSKNSNLILTIGLVIAVALSILLAILIIKLTHKKPKIPEQVQTQTQEQSTIKFNQSKIDDMIKKANSLYESGDKFEALKIYENVAIYNEALSNYNLGVSQMNQFKFKEALESFKNAIKNRENITTSAINAAVCSLELKDKELFNYYINLANAFLANESDSKLYNYYNALINYYKGYYIEALMILNNVNEPYYTDEIGYLRAKILTYLNKNQNAIDILKGLKRYNNDLAIGLSYARMGDYSQAEEYLSNAAKNNDTKNIATAALGFVNLKMSNYANAWTNFTDINDANKSFITKKFPIQVILKPHFFDIHLAQQNFNINSLFDKQNIYEILFYFAPYKAFNPNQTIEYIRKGGISAFIDQNSVASDYLKTSRAIAKANLNLSKAISEALNYNLREANKQFLQITKIYSNQSILHYNLALSYAQLGIFAQAYKHFLTSYHLDQNNYLSGVFAIISAEIIGKDNKKLTAEVLENLTQDPKIDKNNIYAALIWFSLDNIVASTSWMESSQQDKKPFSLAFKALLAQLVKNKNLAQQNTLELKQILPNDILTNILYITTKFDSDKIKEYAKDIQYIYFNKNLNKQSLYGGANIIKTQYIKLLQIAGLLDIQRQAIKNDLELSSNNQQNILEALAYIDLFTGNYEESYSIYNELIDEYKLNDSNTLFLASMASIAAQHPQTAIAYLELSKILDPSSYESILTLGLLYQEANNIQAAINQYKLLTETKFKSKFIDFKLKN